MDNDLHFYEILSGIERSGATYASVNYDLTTNAIIRDSGPAVLVTTPRLAELSATVTGDRPPNLQHVLVVDGNPAEVSTLIGTVLSGTRAWRVRCRRHPSTLRAAAHGSTTPRVPRGYPNRFCSAALT
jgi:hypothetical protein